MIDYRLEIEIDKEDNGTINDIQVTAPNNLSFQGGEYKNSFLETLSLGGNPFTLFGSKLNGGSYFSNGYDGAMSYIFTGTEGNITKDYKIIINGENIKKIIIFFDNITYEYATRLSINNELHYNSETMYIYEFRSPVDVVEIKFLKWNLPHKYIKFTAIRTNCNMSFNQFTGLLEFTRGSQSMQDNIFPEYGLISQYGSCKLLDYKQELYLLELFGLLNENVKFKFYMDNELVGCYNFESLDKDEKNHIYNITLNDYIIKFNDIKFNGEINIKQYENEYNLPKVYYNLQLLTKSYFPNVEFADLTENQIDYLNDIDINNDFIYVDNISLFELWNKFCKAYQCIMYLGTDYKIHLIIKGDLQ